jgi:hypothetical protein
MAQFSVSKVRKRRIMKSLYFVRACVRFKLLNQLEMFTELRMEIDPIFLYPLIRNNVLDTKVCNVGAKITVGSRSKSW